ncbi:MAG: Xanthine/uracil permease [Candidatus Tokpelaia hoelldobleri]|uniref:Xanthine/uracil permease n=1 Tax=Candidatus Tokpelaia hoelldobleri TaxID=1902579 RepID=A0A1U9JTJ7_9HYPH|nr:MAG: Xanthine/uracil permease [Candidatus Tokpelaia hoelldoblerii]
MFEKIFALRHYGTDPRTEIVAGLTTFLTMSYILAVNPTILAAAHMDKGAVFVATCVAAIIGSLIMAFVANWPVGMAPGMGLNAFFAYTVVLNYGYTWQEALGAVFISGLVFLLLTATGVRKWLVAGVPQSLRSAIAAGVGMFLSIVALEGSGIIVANSATLVGLGSLTQAAPLLTIIGFFLIVALDLWNVRGGVLIGILTITVASFFLGLNSVPDRIVSLPPSLSSTFMQMDLAGVFKKGLFHVLLVFVLVEIFDATGTLIGVGKRAGLLTGDREKGLDKALFADSTAIVAGAVIGTSSTTAYVESVSGAAVGGRTGMTALVVAAMFGLALFFSPLMLAVPPYATAPALLFVACLMMREFAEIAWDDLTDAAPAVLTAIMMPLTYSIASGLAFGFISYAVLKTLNGRWREVHLATWVIVALFILRFVIG